MSHNIFAFQTNRIYQVEIYQKEVDHIAQNYMSPQYQNQRVVTTKLLSEALKVDIASIRNTFKQHRDLYKRGIHYFTLEGQELHCFIQHNPRIIPQNMEKAFLWTKIGVFTYLHTLQDEISLDNRNAILQKLFRQSTNEFDILRSMIDSIEKTRLRANEAIERVQRLEDAIDITIGSEDVKAFEIAHHLNLYSKSGLPHTILVSAIAKLLKMKKGYKGYYRDEDIKIVPEQIDEDKYWQVYYRPAGAKKIVGWFKKNKATIEFTEYYKRNCPGGKKGEVKKHGYIVNSIKYVVT